MAYLSGVDGEEDRADIEKSALSSRSAATRIAAITGIIVGIAMIVSVIDLAFGGQLHYGLGAVCGLVAVLAIRLWERWHIRRGLRSVLRQKNRCDGCGYLLVGNTIGVCPECGKRVTAKSVKS